MACKSLCACCLLVKLIPAFCFDSSALKPFSYVPVTFARVLFLIAKSNIYIFYLHQKENIFKALLPCLDGLC